MKKLGSKYSSPLMALASLIVLGVSVQQLSEGNLHVALVAGVAAAVLAAISSLIEAYTTTEK